MKTMKMLAAAFFFFLIFSGCTKKLQTELARLEEENKDLRNQLELCQSNSQFSFFQLSKDEARFPNTVSYAIKKGDLLRRLEEAYPHKMETAKAAEELVLKLEQFIETLRKELIMRTGGYMEGAEPQKPKGFRNKEITTHILVKEGRGKILKMKLINFRKDLLGLVGHFPELNEKIITGKLGDGHIKSGKSWEEYKFNQMPLGAVLPILSVMVSDAKKDEIAILEFLIK